MRFLIAALLLVPASCAVSADGPPDGAEPPLVRWRAKLGFTGGSPAVSDGLVWIGTTSDSPRAGDRREGGGVLKCFRERDGALLWQLVSPRRIELPEGANWAESPVRGSPRIEGDRLWYLNSRWEVVCLDIGPLNRGRGEPREVWKTDLVVQTGTRPRTPGMVMGPGCTIPPSFNGKLYVSTGNGPDYASGKMKSPEAPALVCLDKETGTILGREASGISPRSTTANRSSPVLIAVADGHGGERTRVLYGGGDGFLYAFDPVPVEAADPAAKGILREVWRADCTRKGDPAGILAPPVPSQGKVYVALGRELDESVFDGRLCCVDGSTGKILWSSEQVHVTTCSPLVQDGIVIVADSYGEVHAFDSETGRPIWKHDALSALACSPLRLGDRVLVGSVDGDFQLLDARTGKPGPGRLQVPDGAFESSPLRVGETIYISGGTWLYALNSSVPPLAGPGTVGPRRGRSPPALFVPTPHDIVDAMLKLAEPSPADTLVDLGSGDGRIVVAAARAFGCRATGYEIDRTIVERSREAIRREGLEARASIVHEDLLKADLSGASVVTLYLGQELNRCLIPQLQLMKPGSRIVSHEFTIPGVKAERERWVVSLQDLRSRTLYLYRTPLTWTPLKDQDREK